MLPIRNNGYSAAVANDVQQNAQANVPGIPNNGNPAGANNMPANSQPQAPQYFQYSVGNPSPYMQAITAMLTSNPQPIPQQIPQEQPAVIMPMRQVNTPVFPARAIP